MFITIRSLIHIGCLSPLLWLGYILYYGDISQVFGADPIKELIHFLGLTALYIFSALFVLRIITQLNGQAKLRSLHRDLGLWGLFWLCLHLTSYLLFELALDYRLFLSEIIKRPYLIIGAIAFLRRGGTESLKVSGLRDKKRAAAELSGRRSCASSGSLLRRSGSAGRAATPR